MIRFLIPLACALSLLTSGSSADEGAKWTYDGQHGPEQWGDLADEFDMCRRGLNQSPVDLVADLDVALPELKFEYTKVGGLKEVNTGHAIQDSVIPGNYFWVKGIRFELKQFHFHSPSEHLVNGKPYPMEVHLVHQNDRGEYAVVSMFFEEGARNEIIDRLPSFRASRGEDPYGDPFDYNLLFPNRTDYFHYNGSLTTPPCSEGVAWIVIKQPIIVSADQITHYHDLLGFDNNRPIQPKHSRFVLD
jgi:carbonic anhydrase